jgi:hypothetical protein
MSGSGQTPKSPLAPACPLSPSADMDRENGPLVKLARVAHADRRAALPTWRVYGDKLSPPDALTVAAEERDSSTAMGSSCSTSTTASPESDSSREDINSAVRRPVLPPTYIWKTGNICSLRAFLSTHIPIVGLGVGRTAPVPRCVTADGPCGASRKGRA